MTRGSALLYFATWCVLSAFVWLYPVHDPMWFGYVLRALAPLFTVLYFRQVWKGPPQTHSFRGEPYVPKNPPLVNAHLQVARPCCWTPDGSHAPNCPTVLARKVGESPSDRCLCGYTRQWHIEKPLVTCSRFTKAGP